MKKKSLNPHRRKKPSRRLVGSDRTKPRQIHKKKKNSGVSMAWLRILPIGIEDDPPTDFSKGFFSDRNGRRQPRDLDLYTPEENQRSR